MVEQKYRWDFIGLSTEEKPTPSTSPKVVDGSTFYCSDNSKLYVWCKTQWYERKALGGGGGGGSYTAGTGIDITDDTISVDTTTIQEKLTAGTNVTISDNTISATDTTYSDFTGTDGTAAGTAGLVPAPATTDAGKFLKADGTWDTAGGGGSYTAGDGINITGDVISATNTGKGKTLTSSDYNWNYTTQTTANPNCVALWLLDDGLYEIADADTTLIYASTNLRVYPHTVLLGTSNNNRRESLCLVYTAESASEPQTWVKVYVSSTSGTLVGDSNGNALIDTNGVVNSLNSTKIKAPLSANQGKVLKDLIDSLAFKNAGAPTTATVGTVGQLLEDTTNGKLYICTAIVPGTDPDPDTYTWTEVGVGGSGPTVVQTTGTSTTDVMSQNATTSMVFADPDNKSKVQIGGTATGLRSVAIGNGAQTASNNSYDAVAIGRSARSSHGGSVALGAFSDTSAVGEVNIGTSSTSYGYTGNSNYRLLTGLYDPQSAHDAATKGYVDAGLSYSTTEVATGGTWTDGSAIYKKTINFGALPNNTLTTVNHSISNLGSVIRIEGIAIDSTANKSYSIPHSSPSSLNGNISVVVDATTVGIRTGEDRSSYNGYITLYYTKTA